MSYRVIITPTADAEAMESFRWYADRSPGAAARWYAGLNRALAGLSENPTRYAVSDEDSVTLGREIRFKLYGRRRGVFRILFAIQDDIIFVLRIRHSARGPIET